LHFGGEDVADYAFRTLEDRQKIEKLWEDGRTPKEISASMDKSLAAIYAELPRGQDGTRLPDKRLRYSAELAQLRVQQSLEKRGKRTGKPTDSGQVTQTATNR
jgi:IS30 family transposase